MPDVLDAWRMIAARRRFEGRFPLADFARLRDSLEGAEGEAQAVFEFDRDSLRTPYVELRLRAQLPLVCQRSLQRFLFPVDIVQRLGLIRDEADEAALPPGYEPLLLADDGLLRPADLVEDELILALPVIPVAPGTEALDRQWSPASEEAAQANPFAALAALKRNS